MSDGIQPMSFYIQMESMRFNCSLSSSCVGVARNEQPEINSLAMKSNISAKGSAPPRPAIADIERGGRTGLDTAPVLGLSAKWSGLCGGSVPVFNFDSVLLREQLSARPRSYHHSFINIMESFTPQVFFLNRIGPFALSISTTIPR